MYIVKRHPSKRTITYILMHNLGKACVKWSITSNRQVICGLVPDTEAMAVTMNIKCFDVEYIALNIYHYESITLYTILYYIYIT